MILAVTGGRDYIVSPGEFQRLGQLLLSRRATVLRHGGCRGVDRAVAHFVSDNFKHVRVEEYAASWAENGKAAGPIRNSAMLLEADGLLAFQGGKGTADAVAKARAAGIPIYTIDVDPRADDGAGEHNKGGG